MRPSPLRHTLAVLRTTIRLTQKEMAELAECSTATIQAIELGKLKLSEKLAGLISQNTAIDQAWLLENDVSKPMLNAYGNPYYPRQYTTRAAPRPRDNPRDAFDLAYNMQAAVLRAIYFIIPAFIEAQKHGKSRLLDYKLRKALEAMSKEFPTDKRSSAEIHRLIGESHPVQLKRKIWLPLMSAIYDMTLLAPESALSKVEAQLMALWDQKT